MSSVLIIQQYDNIYIGSDSAISAKINNQNYRLASDGKKLYHIDNQVIFCSGNLNIANTIMNEYINNVKHTPSNISIIAKKNINKLFEDDFIEIIIAEQNKKLNKINLYQISSYNNFDIQEKNIKFNETAFLTGGIYTSLCFNTALNYMKQNTDVNYIYENTFNNISCEEIGGYLTVYQVNNSCIKKIIKKKIKEKENLKYINLYDNANLVTAEQLFGQIVASERLIITNSAGNFIVDELGVTINNLILTVTRQDNLVKTTIDPQVGIKIQENVNGAFVDRLFADNAGKLNATSFKVNNTNSTLDDTGLTIYNGKIDVKNSSGTSVFNTDVYGNLNYQGYMTSPYATINGNGLTVNQGKMVLTNPNGTVIIDGQHNIHKIIATGTAIFTVPAGTASYSATITALGLLDDNGVSYIPVCHVYQQMESGLMGLCPTLSIGSSGTSALSVQQIIRASANTSALTLYVDRCSDIATSALTIKVRYYVYKETAF